MPGLTIKNRPARVRRIAAPEELDGVHILYVGPDGITSDRWKKTQGGIRPDWNRARDSWTVQGDVYRAEQNTPAVSDPAFSAANVLGRWLRTTATSRLMIQAYYDHTERSDS